MRNSILVGLVVLAMVVSVQASAPTLSIDYLLVDGKAIKTDGTLKEAYWFGGGQTNPITAFGITWAYLDAFDNSPPEGSGSLDHNGAAFTGNELIFVRDVPNCAFSNITGTWTGLTIGAEYRA
ncbi:MAG: hypothetical protein NTV86_17450, partial [Planctomycetota bacterium]|nr:hypothetical protein [Planctomycetota bacterium]